MPGDAGECRHLLSQHAAREALDTHAREHAERNLRADTGDLEQVAEQAPLLLGRETVEDMRILAHHQVRDQVHGLAHRGQIQEGGHGCFELIAHTADIQRHRRGRLGRNASVQEADQLATSNRSRRLWA